MTEPITTPQEALEAAAQWHEDFANRGDDFRRFDHPTAAVHRDHAREIRALSSRIALPVVSVEKVARAITVLPAWTDNHNEPWPWEEWKDEARAAIIAMGGTPDDL